MPQDRPVNQISIFRSPNSGPPRCPHPGLKVPPGVSRKFPALICRSTHVRPVCRQMPSDTPAGGSRSDNGPYSIHNRSETDDPCSCGWKSRIWSPRPAWRCSADPARLPLLPPPPPPPVDGLGVRSRDDDPGSVEAAVPREGEVKLKARRPEDTGLEGRRGLKPLPRKAWGGAGRRSLRTTFRTRCAKTERGGEGGTGGREASEWRSMRSSKGCGCVDMGRP